MQSAIKNLIHTINKPTTLWEVLNLSYNNLSDTTVIHLIDALCDNKFLKNLDLSFNKLTVSSFYKIGTSLSRFRLKELNFSGNYVDT